MRASRLLPTLLLATALLAPSRASAGWQKDDVCQGGCGGGCGPCSDGGGGGATDLRGLAPGSVWDGTVTSSYFTDLKNCTNPVCAAWFMCWLPVGMVLDTPYYAIQGLKYGFIYGGKGVVAAGKGIGAAAAYPFNRPPAPVKPPTTWEQYKHDVLKRQKQLAKAGGPSEKETQLWCVNHVPLEVSPNRAAWEQRCNAGGAVAASSLPPATSEFGAMAAAPAPVTSESSSSVVMPSAAAAPAATSASVPADAAAPAAASPAVPVTPAVFEGSTAASPAAAVAVSASPTPAPAAAATVAAVTPSVKDPAAALAGVREAAAKAASQGGFDSASPMMGSLPSAPASPSGAAITPTLPAPEPPAAEAAATPGASPSRGMYPAGSSALPVIEHPIEAGKKTALLGDPDKYRDFFKVQTGQTCALVSTLQLLGGLGISATEDGLFQAALYHGYFGASYICNVPDKGDYCTVAYDANAKKCRVEATDGQVSPWNASTCEFARRIGGTTAAGMGHLLADQAGKPVLNRYGRSIRDTIHDLGAADAVTYLEKVEKTDLPIARAELVQQLLQGKAVIVTLEAKTLWKKPGPPAMHAVVVTGAQVRTDGTVEGFYINDSGTGDYARLVPLRDFETAWLRDDLQRVYLK